MNKATKDLDQAKDNAYQHVKSFLDGKKFTLVTGIANPIPLVTFLNDKGLQFEHLKYRTRPYQYA